MPAFVAKSADAWIRQARHAIQALTDQLPPGDRRPLIELADVDLDLFATLIEALYALGCLRDDDPAVTRAGLRPVDEVLGLPPGQERP
jgi:hypothetical protein